MFVQNGKIDYSMIHDHRIKSLRITLSKNSEFRDRVQQLVT